MPYKNIEDRRNAWKRWAKKHLRRPDVQMKRKARDKARWNVEKQICSIKDCEEKGELHHEDYFRPMDVISLCKKHHEAIHHTRKCIICGDKHRARGYCNRHWKQWKKGTGIFKPVF